MGFSTLALTPHSSQQRQPGLGRQSFLPSVVPRDRLVEGNSCLLGCTSAVSVVGPAVGGWLVQAVTAPLAILADALSFAASVCLLLGVRTSEPPPCASC